MESPSPSRKRVTGLALGVGLPFYVATMRLGLAPLDVFLVYAVGGFAWKNHAQAVGYSQPLLGEEHLHHAAHAHGGKYGSLHTRPRTTFAAYLRDNHQLLGCFVRGSGRSRTERILAVALTTLALLYWKVLFRPQRVAMGSLQGLRNSLWTLVVSKGMQTLMKRAIVVMAGRTAAWHADAGWLETLQLQWRVLQYWVIGLMVLCVILFLTDGWGWSSTLSHWLIQLAFALLVMDLVFCYMRYHVFAALVPVFARLQAAYSFVRAQLGVGPRVKRPLSD